MVFGLLSLGLWFLLWVGQDSAPPMEPRPLKIALVVFLGAVGLSYALAMSRPISPDEISPADVALLSLLSWSGTMLVAHDGIRTRESLRRVVWWMAASGGLLAGLGIVQFFSGRAIVDVISVPGLTSVSSAEIIIRNGLVRPAGTAIHPIEYGTLLSLLLPLTFHVAFHHRERPLLLRWAPVVAVGAIIAVSSSRSAYVSAAIALVVSLWGWSPRRRRAVLAALVVGLGAVMVAAPRVIRSATNLFAVADEDPSIESRTDSFSFAWTFIIQHPFFGRGLGTLLPKYRIFDNQYLLLIVTVGIVGTLAFLGIAIAAVGILLRERRGPGDPDGRELASALIAATASGFASLAFFDAFAFPMTMGALFLVLGVAGALARVADDPWTARDLAEGEAPRHQWSPEDQSPGTSGPGQKDGAPPD